MKHAFIVAHKAVYPVTLLHAVLDVARNWFYGFACSVSDRQRREMVRLERDAALLPRIKRAFTRSKKRYGSKRLLHSATTVIWVTTARSYPSDA